MSDFPPIWFLRHGETEWNATRRIQGQLESRLTERGRWHASEQARIVPPILATGPRVMVSPLGRAQETARIALGDTEFETDPLLMEIHAGDWQGMLYEEVMEQWPDKVHRGMRALDIFTDAPGGEGLTAFSNRVRGVIEALDGPTMIVAHGLWGQVMRGIVRGLSHAETVALDNLQGVVYHLENGQEKILRAPAS